MRREQRPRAWWIKTVGRWRRSGLRAAEFAAREDLSLPSLRWWSSALNRDTRAPHGSQAIEAIEIELSAAPQKATSTIEVALADGLLRFDVGADVEYVAALVRALRGR